MADGYDDELVDQADQPYTSGDDDQSESGQQSLGDQLGLQDIPGAQPQAVEGDVSMPLPEDEASQKPAKNWLRELVDYARDTYGMNPETGIKGDETIYENDRPGQKYRTRGILPGDDEEPEDEEAKAFADRAPVEKAIPDEADQSAQAAPPEKMTKPKGLYGMEPKGYEDTGAKEASEQTSEKIKGAVSAAFAKETPEQARSRNVDPGRILAYLSGQGAMDDNERKQREQAAEASLRANGTLGPNGTEIRQKALQDAALENKDKGVALLQNDRKHQSALRVMAGAALDSGDKQTAAKLFNEAHTYVPDGIHAVATPSPTGMRIGMFMPDGSVKNIDLTDNQFRELAHMRAGEFDHLIENGLHQTASMLSRSPGQPAGFLSRTNISTSPGQQITGGRNPTAEAASDVRAARQGPAGNPMPWMQKNPDGSFKDNSPEARAQRALPWASQGKERGKYVETLRKQDTDAEIARQKETGKDTRQEKGAEAKKELQTQKDTAAGERQDKSIAAKKEITKDTLAQKDRHLQYLEDKSFMDRFSKQQQAEINRRTEILRSKMANGKPLDDGDKQFMQQMDALARRHVDEMQKQSAPQQTQQPAGSQPGANQRAPQTQGGYTVMVLPNGQRVKVKQ